MRRCERNVSRIATPSAPPFFRIGRAAEFVQQHQRLRRHRLQHLADVRDVGRKTAEAFLDGLLIADVRQHLLEERKLRFRRRHGQPRLRHERQQSYGLHRNRLAAGVRAADQQRALALVERSEIGTTGFCWRRSTSSSNGCRASVSTSRRSESGLKRGIVQSKSSANSALANSSSRAPMASTAA